MNTLSKLIPIPFMILAVAYGIYAKVLLPIFVGIGGIVLYALSLKRDEEASVKLTGLVAMFSSIFALWENPVRYLAIVGIFLLAILEFSAMMRRREIKRATGGVQN
ncbi:hypothetical protein [Thermococcus gorgonarius]|uniref:Uncharacterized protein n=1 Tax=Thermococcus gorgonarius TaxID=71997 RepID=A0A2Z2M783_THEGO|nr:hypothetical protein [Thermococcus gorgonarius]ASJ01133.1 hypothetical protein A3K92_06375 [Thermococcus gorgonarius]